MDNFYIKATAIIQSYGDAVSAEKDRRIAELEALVRSAADIMGNCNVSFGCCCCGEDMETHSDPMSAGHAPVDQGAYAVSNWLETVGKVENQAPTRAAHNPAEGGLRCYDCGRPYGDPHGFPDLVIPHDVWNDRVSPVGHEGGLLCPSCMCKAAHKAGVTCEAKFTSGPFCAPEHNPAEQGD